MPGMAWVPELGDIGCSSSPTKLVGSRGRCPSVARSGRADRRGSLAKNGLQHLRWALVDAPSHAGGDPVYAEHYQRTRTRLGCPAQGGSSRGCPQAGRSLLAHGHQGRTSGSSKVPASGDMTALF